MTEEEFRANPPRPGDKVWIAPLEVESVHNASVVGLDSRGYRRTYYPADIDRIERAPRVLKVGDRVRFQGSQKEGAIEALHGRVAWVLWDKNAQPGTQYLTDLEPLDD